MFVVLRPLGWERQGIDGVTERFNDADTGGVSVSPDAQAVFFFIAFACFVVAAILSFMPRSWVMTLVASGLASWVFVLFWTAVKAA